MERSRAKVLITGGKVRHEVLSWVFSRTSTCGTSLGRKDAGLVWEIDMLKWIWAPNLTLPVGHQRFSAAVSKPVLSARLHPLHLGQHSSPGVVLLMDPSRNQSAFATFLLHFLRFTASCVISSLVSIVLMKARTFE
jgi:hypothetical protein